MIEEVTRKDTINKDTVHKMLKNNKAYLKGLEAERRELIQQLSDCQKQLADLELFADIQNEISISPHIDQAAVSNGHTGDPVGKLVCIRNTKYQSVERAIRHIYANWNGTRCGQKQPFGSNIYITLHRRSCRFITASCTSYGLHIPVHTVRLHWKNGSQMPRSVKYSKTR